MELSTCSRCMKCLMFVAHFLFVISGAILLITGSVVLENFNEYHQFLSSKFISVPHLLIVTGSVIFFVAIFIAFFGYLFSENYCMLIIFTSLLGIICIMELAAGISGYILRNEARGVIHQSMYESMSDYNNSPSMWDGMQKKLKCCGTDEATDWSKVWKNDTEWLPVSCCDSMDGTIGTSHCTLSLAHKNGCFKSVQDTVISHAVALGVVGIGVAVVQAVGIWFSIFLTCSIRRTYESV